MTTELVNENGELNSMTHDEIAQRLGSDCYAYHALAFRDALVRMGVTPDEPFTQEQWDEALRAALYDVSVAQDAAREDRRALLVQFGGFDWTPDADDATREDEALRIQHADESDLRAATHNCLMACIDWGSVSPDMVRHVRGSL